MKNSASKLIRSIGAVGLAAAAALPLLAPTPAQAWWRGGWGGWGGGVYFGFPAPIVVAPPPVVYAPPPVYYAPPVAYARPVWIPPHWAGGYWVRGHWG